MGSSTDDAAMPEPKRFWTVAEANERLASLRESLSAMRSNAVRLQAVTEERERLGAFWGPELRATDHPDRALVERLEREGEGLRSKVESELRALHDDGIEVKDLDANLVDFYAVVDREVVFLCWKTGEPEVAFYHTLTGGFRSRRALSAGRRDALTDARRAPH